MDKNWIKFDGNNWGEVLIFLNGGGCYIKRYDEGEIISFIYISSIDSNTVPGDVIMIDDEVKIFTKEEWKLFTLPPYVIECERLLNILKDNLDRNVMIFDMISRVSKDDLNINTVFTYPDCYQINDCRCRIVENKKTKLYEVSLYED